MQKFIESKFHKNKINPEQILLFGFLFPAFYHFFNIYFGGVIFILNFVIYNYYK